MRQEDDTFHHKVDQSLVLTLVHRAELHHIYFSILNTDLPPLPERAGFGVRGRSSASRTTGRIMSRCRGEAGTRGTALPALEVGGSGEKAMQE